MADEPILCFDGDKAGIRAAHRAADLALPQLQPGKSLRFALLPEGQDPDDLIRAAGARGDGRGARRRAAAGRPDLERARPRPASSTRRSGARRWKRGSARSPAAIGDESVRRHYSQAFAERVAAFFPARRSRTSESRVARAAQSGGGGRGRSSSNALRRRPAMRQTAIPVSDRLRRSQHSRRPARRRRSARWCWSMTMVNHPALLARHLDEFAHARVQPSRPRQAARRGPRDRRPRRGGRRRGRCAKRWNPRAACGRCVARLDAQIAAIGLLAGRPRPPMTRRRGGLAAGFDLAPAQADVT